MTPTAILNPTGPNFEFWNQVLASHRVPLVGPEADDQGAYQINLRAMTLTQRSRLVSMTAQKFHTSIREVEQQIAIAGFPIQAADVIVDRQPA